MISAIICSREPARFGAVCDNLRARFGTEPHEFVHIADARSLAEGYNRGLRKSVGDVIILCHDDIEILAEDFTQRLLSRLQKYDLLGVAGSTRFVGPKWVNAAPPYIFGQIAHFIAAQKLYNIVVWGAPARCIPDIQVMDGVFLAGRRSVFESITFDEETFQRFHLYDIDFTARASRAGFRLAVCNDLMLIHSSSGKFDEAWRADAYKFMAKHSGHIQPVPQMAWKTMGMQVTTKEQVIELLRPRYWPE